MGREELPWEAMYRVADLIREMSLEKEGVVEPNTPGSFPHYSHTIIRPFLV